MTAPEIGLSPQELYDRLELSQKQIIEYSRDFAQIYRQERERSINLQEMHEKLRAVVNSIFDALVATDDQLVIQDFNTAFGKLIPNRDNSILGRSLLDVLPMGPFHSQIEDLRLQGCSRVNFEFSPADQNEVTYLTTVTKISNPQKETEYVFTFRDITEGKLLERLRGRLFTFASNEIRTPLKGLLGFLNYMYDDFGKRLNEDELAHFRFLIESGENLEKIVEDLMRLSPLSQDKDTLNSPVDLNHAIQSTIEKVESDSRSLGIEVCFNSGIEAVISADKILLSRALESILRNLMFSAKSADKITIGLARKRKVLEVRFACSAHAGMSSDIKRLLMAGNGGQENIGQHDISMALAKDIIEWNGGHVRVEGKNKLNLVIGFSDWRAVSKRGKRTLG